MKKQEFKKNEKKLRNLQDILKRSNIRIIGVPEGEEEEGKNWNLIWTNNEGELPQSGNGNRLAGSPGSSESPKEVGPKEEHTPRHIIITLPKIKEKERILEAAREKETVTYKGVPIRP